MTWWFYVRTTLVQILLRIWYKYWAHVINIDHLSGQKQKHLIFWQKITTIGHEPVEAFKNTIYYFKSIFSKGLVGVKYFLIPAHITRPHRFNSPLYHFCTNPYKSHLNARPISIHPARESNKFYYRVEQLLIISLYTTCSRHC